MSTERNEQRCATNVLDGRCESVRVECWRRQGMRTLLRAGLAGLTGALFVLAYTFVQTWTWQFLAAAAGIGITGCCVLVAVLALRRGRDNRAELLFALGLLPGCVLAEITLAEATLPIVVTVTALALLIMILAPPSRRIRAAMVTLAVVGMVLLAHAVHPFTRSSVSLSLLVGGYLWVIAVIAVGALAWKLFRFEWAFGTIRSRMVVAFVLLVLLATGAVSVSSLLVTFRNGRHQAISQLESIAALKSAEIRSWMQNLQIDLHGLAEDGTVRTAAIMLSRRVTPEEYLEARQKLKIRFLQVIELTRRFDEMFVMSKEGLVIVSTNPAKETEFRGLQAYFKDGLVRAGVHVQTTSYSSSSEGLNAVLAVLPVTNDQGETLGVLCGKANMAKLNMIMVERTGFGASGETYLVGSNRVLMTVTRFPGYRPRLTYVDNGGLETCLQSKQNGHGLYANYHGASVVGVYRWLPHLDAVLLAEREQAETFRPIYTTIAMSAAVCVAAVILAVLASVFFARGLASPLGQLAKTAQRIADGDLSLSPSVEREDEIGSLARAFNSMTAQLREVIGTLRERVEQLSRTEEALRASEEKYRGIVENAVEGIFQTTVKGRFLSANPSTARILGYDSPEDLMEIITDIRTQLYVHPETRDRYIDLLREQNSVSGFEAEMFRKDGAQLWVSLHARPLYGKDNEFEVIEGIMQDITERKQAEEKIRQQNLFLNNVLESLTHPFHVINVNDHSIAIANSAAKKTFGPDTSTCYAFSHGRNAPCHPEDELCPVQLVKRSGKACTVEHIHFDKQGNRRDVEIHAYPVPDSKGNVAQVIEYSIDITERKLTDQALRESQTKYKSLYEESMRREELYRSLLNSSADSIVICDLEERTQYVSPSFVRTFGWTLEEVEGKQIPFVPDSERQATQEKMHDLIRQGVPVGGFETRRCTKDARTVDVSVSASTYLDHEGNPAGVLVILRDITDNRRMEAQLRQAAKMEAIGQLAGGVAHDFNNLLTAMIGYAGLLFRELPREGPYHKHLSEIGKAADRGADLTRQLLAFGRKQVLAVRALDLNTLIGDFERILRRVIGENIVIETLRDESLGTVEADPGQVEQILMNLCVNARDAMPNGGKLTIETANVTLDEEYVRTHPDVPAGPYVMIAVSDTGLGMDSRTRSRVFDPFFTTKEKGLGTGLGLSTVYGIVKQHRGHVTVYSERGSGSVFKVYLPLIDAIPENAPQPPITISPPHGDETILFVEDEKLVRDLACEVLELLGYHPLPAAGPDEATDICFSHEGPIHLMLTDVVLPKMDGKSLYEELVKTRPEMKVLYVSGYTENFIVHHGVLDRAVHFMQKPFSVDSLSRRVRQVLDET